MTTIAYDGRYIAVDGRESMGSTIFNDATDKFFVRGKNVFALCGKSTHALDFANQFSHGCRPSDPENEAGGILFDGELAYLCIVENDTKLFAKIIISPGFWADGSGRDWAIAALDHGKTAVEAVKYAMTRDACTGGTIRCYDTKTKKFIKVK